MESAVLEQILRKYLNDSVIALGNWYLVKFILCPSNIYKIRTKMAHMNRNIGKFN